MFNSPFVKISEENIEDRFDDMGDDYSNVLYQGLEKNKYIVNRIHNQERLYDINSLEKEAFIMNTFEIQFEEANIRSVCSACAEKPINLFAKLMPTVNFNFIWKNLFLIK